MTALCHFDLLKMPEIGSIIKGHFSMIARQKVR